jgi:transposase
VPWDEHQEALAENARLKAEVEFLGKVSAFFAAKQK